MSRMVKLYTAAGVEQTPDDEGVYTLADSTVYYAEFFDAPRDRIGWSVHWKWNAALVAAITIEKSNRAKEAGVAGGSVTSYATAGWATTSAATVSPAGSAAEQIEEYTDDMAARRRAKIDVTTGGTLSGFEHSKMRGV